MDNKFDIIICGASLGGTLAAYSAAKSGKKVLLLEETKWIGGQLTSQAVPPDEHKWIEEQGCTKSYRDYRKKIRDIYISNPNFKRAIWDKDEIKNVYDYRFCPASSEVSRISHPPKLALKLLKEMLSPYDNLTVITEAKLLKSKVEEDIIISVTYLINDEEIEFFGKYFIDGTDTGELLPLTNTEYFVGAESKKDTNELHAPERENPTDMQPAIYSLAFAKRDSGSYIIEKPKEYDYFKSLMMSYDKYPIFSMYGPDSSTGKAKLFGMNYGEFDNDGKKLFPLFVYRRIVCRDNYIDNKDICDITLLNWPQNDYFMGNLIETENPDYQKYMAKQLTLSFFYYLQTEVERPDGKKGYPNFELRYDILGTEDGLTMAPYIRESRRIKAKFQITEQMIVKGSKPMFFDSVGVGSYPIDLHITTGTNQFFYEPTERFTIPLGAMIPIRTKNLIPGCKNIGTTHLTNGSYRLHPIEWNIGEVAGFLSCYAIEKNLFLQDIYDDKDLIKEFQDLLTQNGIQLYWK